MIAFHPWGNFNFFFDKYEEYFKCFASLIHSPQKINNWTSNKKKLYSPGYNLLVDIITILSEVFFIPVDEFIDACGGILCHYDGQGVQKPRCAHSPRRIFPVALMTSLAIVLYLRVMGNYR